MRLRRTCGAISAIGITLGVIGACTPDDPAGNSEQSEPPAALYSVATLPDEAIFEDALMLPLAKEMPTFGGFYRTADGAVEIAMTDPNRFSEATGRVADLLPPRPAGIQPSFRLRTVRYSFLELARYRTVLGQTIFTIPGVNRLGVDEDKNVVHVGVEHMAAEARVRQLARSLEIPQAVILISYGRNEELRDPSRLPAPITSLFSHDLTQAHPDSVIEGGWRIGPNGCTLGFPALRVSDQLEVFVTASHCSGQAHHYDGTTFYQPSHTIGQELTDPNTFSCQGVSTCADADAALVTATRDINLGKIARPDSVYGCSNGCVVSLDIYHANPTITLTGQTLHTVVWDEMWKVGATTGWTLGYITDTCEDVTLASGFLIRCSDFVNQMSAQGGDSGSPVFTYSGSATSGTGVLRGIIFGKHTDGGTGQVSAWMSDLNQIQSWLNVSLAGYDPVEPIAVLSGPTSVRTNMQCTWSASSSTGYGTLNYEWTWNGSVVGDEVEYVRIVSSSGTLSLKVTDDLNRADSTSISVTASANGPTPPQCTF